MVVILSITMIKTSGLTAPLCFLEISMVTMLYCIASSPRLMSNNMLMVWKARKFWSMTDGANCEPTEAKPTIVASWTTLHTRSKTESRANRTSKNATCSHVPQIMAKKPMYEKSAGRWSIRLWWFYDGMLVLQDRRTIMIIDFVHCGEGRKIGDEEEVEEQFDACSIFVPIEVEVVAVGILQGTRNPGDCFPSASVEGCTVPA